LKKLQIQVDGPLILHNNKSHRSDFGLFNLDKDVKQSKLMI